MYFVIRNKDDNTYLNRIAIGATSFISPLGWTNCLKFSLHFLTKAEANATVHFLTEVLDVDPMNLVIEKTG